MISVIEAFGGLKSTFNSNGSANCARLIVEIWPGIQTSQNENASKFCTCLRASRIPFDSLVSCGAFGAILGRNGVILRQPGKIPLLRPTIKPNSHFVSKVWPQYVVEQTIHSSCPIERLDNAEVQRILPKRIFHSNLSPIVGAAYCLSNSDTYFVPEEQKIARFAPIQLHTSCIISIEGDCKRIQVDRTTLVGTPSGPSFSPCMSTRETGCPKNRIPDRFQQPPAHSHSKCIFPSEG